MSKKTRPWPLPCPFCGSEARESHLGIQYIVVCDKCGAGGPVRNKSYLATRWWNRAKR